MIYRFFTSNTSHLSHITFHAICLNCVAHTTNCIIVHSSSDLPVAMKLIIADAPKWAELRNLQQHGGYYACDCCIKKAEHYTLPGCNGSKRIWPFQNDYAVKRTHQDTLQIASNLENLSYDDRKGVLGKSELFRLHGFNVIDQMLPEPMHLMCEGMGGKLLR